MANWQLKINEIVELETGKEREIIAEYKTNRAEFKKRDIELYNKSIRENIHNG